MSLVWLLTACASTVGPDGSTSDARVDATGSTCTPGTCRLSTDPAGACLPPGGPVGGDGGLAGCCGCGADGICNSMCRCASPDTPIATPTGERPIAAIRVGDKVLSMHHGRLSAVTVRQVHRSPVTKHSVMRVVLQDGRVLEISAAHPTADGRTFGDLRAGDTLGGRAVLSAHLVPYLHDATYDLLPDSDTGTYVAAGALIGSTLTVSMYRGER